MKSTEEILSVCFSTEGYKVVVVGEFLRHEQSSKQTERVLTHLPRRHLPVSHMAANSISVNEHLEYFRTSLFPLNVLLESNKNSN